jgi:hypothetical protein
LIEYYKANTGFYGNITGEEKFEEYLIDRYIENAGRNAQNNDQKSSFLYQSKGFMLAPLSVFATPPLLSVCVCLCVASPTSALNDEHSKISVLQRV